MAASPIDLTGTACLPQNSYWDTAAAVYHDDCGVFAYCQAVSSPGAVSASNSVSVPISIPSASASTASTSSLRATASAASPSSRATSSSSPAAWVSTVSSSAAAASASPPAAAANALPSGYSIGPALPVDPGAAGPSPVAYLVDAAGDVTAFDKLNIVPVLVDRAHEPRTAFNGSSDVHTAYEEELAQVAGALAARQLAATLKRFGELELENHEALAERAFISASASFLHAYTARAQIRAVGGTGVCKHRACRVDPITAEYGTLTPPPLCNDGSYCPARGDACLPLIPLGGSCEPDRDDSCVGGPSSASNITSEADLARRFLDPPLLSRDVFASPAPSALCLQGTCVLANVGLDGSCVSDALSASGAPSGGINSATRDNCAGNLWCDSSSHLCRPQRAIGLSCSTNRECESLFCAEDHLCASSSPQPRKGLPSWSLGVIGTVVAIAALASIVILFRTYSRHRRAGKARRLHHVVSGRWIHPPPPLPPFDYSVHNTPVMAERPLSPPPRLPPRHDMFEHDDYDDDEPVLANANTGTLHVTNGGPSRSPSIG